MPLPILRAKEALAQMESGQVLRVVTTDRNAVRDFQAFAPDRQRAARAAESDGGCTPAPALGGKRVPADLYNAGLWRFGVWFVV